MKLNDMFDAVIVLNLERRSDRLDNITNQLKNLEIIYKKWTAIDHINTDMTPMFCNSMNWLNRLFYAQFKEYKTVLLLDDDCEFVPDFYAKLDEVWPQIPDDWDTVSFGEHLIRSTKITDKIFKIHESYGGHATAVKINCVSNIFTGLTGKNFGDIEMNLLSDKLNRYAINPGLIGQARFQSDLVGEIRPNIYNLWQ